MRSALCLLMRRNCCRAVCALATMFSLVGSLKKEKRFNVVVLGNVQVRTYGIDIRTGRIEWVTDESGHYRSEEQRRSAGDSDSLIVLKRHGHTLRAVNALTGEER